MYSSIIKLMIRRDFKKETPFFSNKKKSVFTWLFVFLTRTVKLVSVVPVTSKNRGNQPFFCIKKLILFLYSFQMFHY